MKSDLSLLKTTGTSLVGSMGHTIPLFQILHLHCPPDFQSLHPWCRSLPHCSWTIEQLPQGQCQVEQQGQVAAQLGTVSSESYHHLQILATLQSQQEPSPLAW